MYFWVCDTGICYFELNAAGVAFCFAVFGVFVSLVVGSFDKAFNTKVLILMSQVTAVLKY